MYRFKTYILSILLQLILASCFISCEKWEYTGKKNIFIIYSIGYNNLNSHLTEDIKDITDNFKSSSPSNIVMIYSHKPAKNADYITPSSPTLTQLSLNRKGKVVTDTLVTYPATTNSASAETLHEVLDFINTKHPGSNCGILFSSHSTGWAPEDYCNAPEEYDSTFEWAARQISRKRTEPTWGIQLPDGSPIVKSFGAQFYKQDGKTMMHEMDITDMAKAFPMKMDYIIFDSCFMGGVEVAYEFRNVCRYMIFSQTEILADGMDYKTITSRVFSRTEQAMKQVCEDYYNQYINQTGSYRSATISLVDCWRIEPLAKICKDIFTDRHAEIAASEGSTSIQKYFRYSTHKWFYDLESIVNHIGTPEDMLTQFRYALDRCVLYKAATERFMQEFDINEHSGLSMYLPYKDRTYLNNFYKTLEWNKATGLVQ